VVHALAGHANEIGYVAFGPDNQLLAAGTRYASEIRIWDLATGRLRQRLEHGNVLSSLELSRDGRSLLTAGWDRTAKLWSLDTGTPARTLVYDTPLMAPAFDPPGPR